MRAGEEGMQRRERGVGRRGGVRRGPLALGLAPAAATRSAAAATGEATTAKAGPVDRRADDLQLAGYIDPGSKGTVAEFEDETGVNVNYIEDINSNDGFFGKMQPQLEQGESGGRSIFVLTD